MLFDYRGVIWFFMVIYFSVDEVFDWRVLLFIFQNMKSLIPTFLLQSHAQLSDIQVLNNRP